MGLIVIKPAGVSPHEFRRVISVVWQNHVHASFGVIIVRVGRGIISRKGICHNGVFNTPTNLWRMMDADIAVFHSEHITQAEIVSLDERMPPFMLRRVKEEWVLDYKQPEAFIVPSVYPFVMGPAGYHTAGFGSYAKEWLTPLNNRMMMLNGSFESLSKNLPGISSLMCSVWGNAYRVYIKGEEAFEKWNGILINSNFTYSKVVKNFGPGDEKKEIFTSGIIDTPRKKKSMPESRYYWDRVDLNNRYKQLYWHKKSEAFLPWEKREPFYIIERPMGAMPIKMISLWKGRERSYLIYEVFHQFNAYPIQQLHNVKDKE